MDALVYMRHDQVIRSGGVLPYSHCVGVNWSPPVPGIDIKGSTEGRNTSQIIKSEVRKHLQDLLKESSLILEKANLLKEQAGRLLVDGGSENEAD